MQPRSRRIIAGIAGAAMLSLPLSACGVFGGDDDKKSAPKAAATIEVLTGNSTAIKLDGGFLKALTALKLTPSVTGGAKLTKQGSLVFPITGGSVSVFKKGAVSPYVIGILFHDKSGLKLTSGKTSVTLTNFIVDPAFSKVYGDVAVNGKAFASKAVLFDLDGRTLNPPTVANGVATLQGTKVEISATAAGALDMVFKTKAVKQGLLVGIATITAKVPKG